MARAAELAPALPGNPEAERSVLGAILLDNSQMDVAAQRIDAEDFLLDQHKRIFRAMAALAEINRPIDLVTLSDFLHVRGELEEAGGGAYISQLTDGVPRIGHLAHYCEIVRGKAILRTLIHASHAIQQSAFEEADEPAILVERAEQAIAGIGERRAASELRPLAAVIEENTEALKAFMTSAHSVSGLPSGYPQLDALLAGFHPGNVIILAARPSIGKTALAINIAENVAKSHIPVALFSLEMSRREILQRIASSAAQINLRQLRAGGHRESWAQMMSALAMINPWPIYIDDANPTTVTEIAAKTRWLKRKQKVGLVIVDYLQLVSGARGRFTNRNEEVGASSRALKAMARSLDVPVLVLSQLTRASEREERRPQLSDLRESGAIEQDADVVLFIHRPKAFAVGEPAAERNKGEVIVAKQRNGPTESVKFVFLAPFTRFEELEPSMFPAEIA